MLLPTNERRKIDAVTKKKIWLYGVPCTGKTYLANKFPEPLMLNTDGNIKFVDAPYITIKDEVVNEGKQVKRTLAWDVFKNVIDELEKKENTFKTIIVDLLEDCYEYCRRYMYTKLDVDHESDAGYGKGYDVIRKEFLDVIKRLMNLDYENIILISHEDRSKDITSKTGGKFTSICPNLTEKVATKIAGMVDIIGRTLEDEGKYTVSFKTNEVVFGGSRLNLKVNEISSEYTEICKLYDEDCEKKFTSNVEEIKQNDVKCEETKQDTAEKTESGVIDVPTLEQPRQRKRRGE